VMEWVPTDNEAVEKVTTSVPDPSTVVPSRKFTVPVGLPDREPLTVAVKVTKVPLLEVLAEDVRVVLAAESTFQVRVICGSVVFEELV